MLDKTVSVTCNEHDFLDNLPSEPGVYKMYNKEKYILYIGKSKNLKKRIHDYYGKRKNIKTQVMVDKISSIDVVVTENEIEALLLEQSLIKKHKPLYNILLKDDKSYPYIIISKNTKWPRISFFRGKKRADFHYFGPYPSVQSVKETLGILQKIFKLRQCTDVFFKNRSRPCLQYQINRCKAPCVNIVSAEEYDKDVKYTKNFLSGKNEELISSLVNKMDEAANSLFFEKAVEIREQIKHLRKIQKKQSIISSNSTNNEVDVIGLFEQANVIGFTVMFIRFGEVVGSQNFILKNKLFNSEKDLLIQFISNFYIGFCEKRQFPEEIIIPFYSEELNLISQGISSIAQKKVNILSNVKLVKERWLYLASKNAKLEVTRHLLSKKKMQEEYTFLSNILDIPKISRMECFDISHTMGENTVASCVVFDRNGPVKNEYRRFNITGIQKSDDYAAMSMALKKRYLSNSSLVGKKPSLIIVDGGKGQLAVAHQTLVTLALDIPVMGIAKGVSRKPGQEVIHYAGQELSAAHMQGCLLLIQRIRDESHRFALEGHRNKREKSRRESPLEEVPGIGKKRRITLLKYFGGIQELMSATPREIAQVKGISMSLAKNIYEYLQK